MGDQEESNVTARKLTCLICPNEVNFSTEEEADDHISTIHPDNLLAGQDIATLFSTTNAAGLQQTLNPLIATKIDPDEMNNTSLENMVEPGDSGLRITQVTSAPPADNEDQVPFGDAIDLGGIPVPPGYELCPTMEYVGGRVVQRFFFVPIRRHSSASTISTPLASPPSIVPDITFSRMRQPSGPRPQFRNVPDAERFFMPTSPSISTSSRPPSNASSSSLEQNAFNRLSVDYQSHLNAVHAQANEALGSMPGDLQEDSNISIRRESATSDSSGSSGFVQEETDFSTMAGEPDYEPPEPADVKPFAEGGVPIVGESAEPKERKFQCRFCLSLRIDYRAEQTCELRQHVFEFHHTLDNYEYCFECGKGYKTKKLLDRHELKCGGVCLEPQPKRPRKK